MQQPASRTSNPIIGHGLGSLVAAMRPPAASGSVRGIHGGKSHSATKKRFKKTGGGIKFFGAGRRHLAQPMNSKRRRRVGKGRYLEGADHKKVLALLHN